LSWSYFVILLLLDLTSDKTEKSKNPMLEILKVYYNDTHPVDLYPFALLNMVSPVKMKNQNFVKTVKSSPLKDIQLLIKLNSVESNKTKLLSQLLLLENTDECYSGIFNFHLINYFITFALQMKDDLQLP
jgi:hypothetical protein